MTDHPLPTELRATVERDLQPVHPLAPAWRRALAVAGLAAVVLAITVMTSHLRADMHHLPMWLTWGAAVLELLVGVLVVGLSLREAVPGSALPRSWAVAAVVIATLVQVMVAAATWMYSPGTPIDQLAAAAGFGCLRHESLLALPAFALTAWLVVRALPVHPAMAGLLGGAGSGLTADAVDHLLCPISNLRHVLVWHTGAIFLFMLLGWTAGWAWERYRSRQRFR